jgi:type I restriction enzyme S subunit
MTEWKEYKLGEIVTFQRGHDLPKDKMIDGDIPVAGSNGIIGYHNQFTKEGPGVTIGRSGNIGIPHYYPNAYWAHNTVLYIIDFKGNDTKFMYYLLKTFDFTQLNTGSAVPSLNRNHIHELPVSIPDLPTQHRIASILSSLDDKIDLLHRENTTLEAMAETLFRQWFIEEVKEDDMCLLGEVIKTTSGGTPSRKNEEYYCNGNIEWVKSKELHHSYILDTEEKITVEAVHNSSAKLLPENSILIAMYGATVGEYGIIAKSMTCNQAICALIPNEKYPYTYLYLWAKFMQDEFINLACGAAQQNISQELIKQQYVSNDIKLISDFHILVNPYMEKMKVNQEQIQTLTQQRDGLLPKLMSGEVKI